METRSPKGDSLNFSFIQAYKGDFSEKGAISLLISDHKIHFFHQLIEKISSHAGSNQEITFKADTTEKENTDLIQSIAERAFPKQSTQKVDPSIDEDAFIDLFIPPGAQLYQWLTTRHPIFERYDEATIERYGEKLLEAKTSLKNSIRKNFKDDEIDLILDCLSLKIEGADDEEFLEKITEKFAHFILDHKEYTNENHLNPLSDKFFDFFNQFTHFVDNEKELIDSLTIAHTAYQIAFQHAKEKALLLHQQLDGIFSPYKASIDPKTNNIVCSSTQLKTAIKLTEIHFPYLTKLASNPSEVSDVARLVQIVLCGEAPEEVNASFSIIFEIAETKGKAIRFPIIPEKVTPLRSIFDEISELPKEEQYIPKNFSSAISNFYVDSVQRTGDVFKVDEMELPIGGKSTERHPFMIEKMNQLYTLFLIDHPEKVVEIIERNKSSTIFQDALKLFPPSAKSLENSSFPKEVLEEMIRAAGFEKELQLVLQHSDMPEQAIKELLGHLNEISPNKYLYRDIEPLIRMKALEMMILMNQATQGFITKKVQDLLDGLQKLLMESNIYDGVRISGGGGKNYYLFDEEFDRFTCLVNFKISSPKEALNQMGVTEHFNEDVEIANFEGVFEVPSLNTLDPIGSNSIPEVLILRNLCVGWKSPEEVSNFLINQAAPELKNTLKSTTQAEKELAAIEKEIKKIENIKIGQISRDLDKESENLGKISTEIISLQQTLQEYFKGAIIENQDPKEMQKVINRWKHHIHLLAEGLANLGNTYQNILIQPSLDEKSSMQIETLIETLQNIVTHQFTPIGPLLSLEFERTL